MSKPRKRSKAYFKQRNHFRGTTEKPEKEYYDIWHWNDNTKRRIRIEDIVKLIFKQGGSVSLKNDHTESEGLLSIFERKWCIGAYFTEDRIRAVVRDNLREYPNMDTAPPKKKFFEKISVYEKRCADFKWFSIEPSEDKVNKEFVKWKSNQQKAINSDEHKQLLQKVKHEKLDALKKNKKRYLELIEINIFVDDDDMKSVWAEIRECCKKDESLKDHYLSLQIEKENAWLIEIEKRKLVKEKRAEFREKQIAEKKAMLARANSESRQLGAKVKFKLRSDHNCPYCNGELGNKYHADHIIPIGQGGLSVKHNMVNVCASCNLSKGDLTLFEFTQKKELDYLTIISTLQKLGKRI